jgi:hypothetical protein
VIEPAHRADHADTAFDSSLLQNAYWASNVGDNDRGDTMIKFRNQLQLFSPTALSIAFLVSFGLITEAKALCNTETCFNGYIACLAWCEGHNKTNHSRGVCSVKCGDYWHDGASLTHGNLPNPSGPPRDVGPGRLKDPPTTVSDPATPRRPVTPVNPVGKSNPNGPGTNNPVIFERKDSGSQSGGHESGGGGGHGK